MKVDLFDIEKFISVNGCQEVTSRFYLDSDGKPADDGLFSTTIFGRIGSDDRKFKFAYIDLKRKFLHPLVYNVIYNMFRALPQVVSGEKSCSIGVNGKIKVEDDLSKGQTGIDFFVNNWKRIKWTEEGEENASRSKKENLLNMLKENEIFIEKFLVIPAYYRDVNFNTSSTGTKVSVDGINASYIKLLTAASSASITFTSAFNTQNTIQKTLNDIYVELTTKISGKTGVIRQAIMGKSIDYSAIAVLSCPRMEANTPEEQQVKFNEYGIPIAFALSLYHPFVIKELEDFFYELEHSYSIVLSGNKKFDIDEEVLDNITPTAIKDLVDSFIKDKTKAFRLRNIGFALKEKNDAKNKDAEFIPIYLRDRDGNLSSRYATLTDLFYVVAFNVTRNKYMIATRYPVTGPESIITCRPVILSTERNSFPVSAEELNANKELKIEDNFILDFFQRPEYKLPYFPVDAKLPLEESILEKKIKWIDTAIPNISYLSGLGADFDGGVSR